MRLCVAGSRDITDYERVGRAIERSGWEVTEVIEGDYAGVDRLAKRWAVEHGVPYRDFPADWTRFGTAAGPIRNGEMAEDLALALPDAGLVLVWDGTSRGSADMRRQARLRGIPVFEDRNGVYYRDGQRDEAATPPVVRCRLGCGKSFATEKKRDEHYAWWHRCALPLPFPEDARGT